MDDAILIQRCFDLARLGLAGVSPNPMVGAILVCNNRIIGEGYHAVYGQKHAEVAAIDHVFPADRALLSQSELYVSLEPCCVVGNTPACTDLIRQKGIKKVHFSTTDPSAGVDGASIDILQSAGCQVTTGLMEEKGRSLIRPRRIWVTQKRPYVILKFARSADGFIGQKGKQLWLSNAYAKLASHKWRSEVSAILVGTETARTDNPRLTNRLFPGSSPLRITIDRKLSLTPDLHLLDGSHPTWIFTRRQPPPSTDNLQYFRTKSNIDFIEAILTALYQHNKGVLLVEGGARLLRSFIDAGCWDEARVFHTPKRLGEGIPVPTIPAAPHKKLRLKEDVLVQYFRKEG